MPSSIISVAQASGPRRTSCGYCSPPGQRSDADTFVQSAGLSALQLSCDVYQKMIDRGWRRSGTWCYKPWLKKSCCPQYTIRLDSTAFAPSKSQRKLINRWNRFVSYGDGLESPMEGQDLVQPTGPELRGSKRPPKFVATPFDFVESLHSAEMDPLAKSEQGKHHRFEVTLEPSSFSEEKFELYRLYQSNIHKDPDNTPSGFKRFLVTSPLAASISTNRACYTT
jgi:arginine-tRNA-protein transferase